MKIRYYLEVVSSWCFWAEPAWAELRRRYGSEVQFEWRLALMDACGLPSSRAQCDWFYGRSGTLVGSPSRLNSGWFEAGRTEYLAPNLVAEAARDFGVDDDRVRLALAHAALREGKKVGDWQMAAEIGSAVTGIGVSTLLAAAKAPATEARARASTAEFHALQVSQRPTFVLENAIGDRTVLSGLWTPEPLIAALDALRRDAAGYASYRAHHGDVPQ